MDRRSGVVITHGVLLLHLIVCSQGLAVSTPQCPPDRGERLFFLAPRVPPQRSAVPTVTTTYTSTRLISEVWLSSCVTYATALPNCPREARGDNLGRSPVENRLDPRDMEVNPTKVQPILSTNAPHLPKDELRENERNFRTFSKPFWEDLVGLAFPLRSGETGHPTPPLHSVPSTSHRDKNTITRTVTVTATKRVKGPKTVVSFSITGCLPSKLPFDLERCDEPERTILTLRNPSSVPKEGPSEVEESSTETPSEETEAPESVTSDPPPTTTEQMNTSEVPTVETSPESEQMIPAPNESVTTTGTPEEHEELGSGFAK